MSLNQPPRTCTRARDSPEKKNTNLFDSSATHHAQSLNRVPNAQSHAYRHTHTHHPYRFILTHSTSPIAPTLSPQKRARARARTPARSPFPSCLCASYLVSRLLSSTDLLPNKRIKLQRLINDLDTSFLLLKSYGIIMILTRTQWLAFVVSLKIFHFPPILILLSTTVLYFELRV